MKSSKKLASPQCRVIVSKVNQMNISLATRKLQNRTEEICTNVALAFRSHKNRQISPVVFCLLVALMACSPRPPTWDSKTHCSHISSLSCFPLSCLCAQVLISILPPQRSHSVHKPPSPSTVHSFAASASCVLVDFPISLLNRLKSLQS